MSDEAIRLDVTAHYRAGAGACPPARRHDGGEDRVTVDSGRRTFHVEQRTRRSEADSAFCPIELVLAGLSA